MMVVIWSLLLQAAAKREEKMANFVQLLTDGVRTTDWLEVFFFANPRHHHASVAVRATKI